MRTRTKTIQRTRTAVIDPVLWRSAAITAMLLTGLLAGIVQPMGW